MKPNPENINEREERLRKLTGSSPDAGFGVPDGYFENFETRVLSQILGEEDKEVKIEGLNNGTPFGVPDGYFESLSERIVAGIQKQEENVGVELMELAGNELAFGVPPNYFEQSQAEIMAKVNALSGKAEPQRIIRPIQRYYRAAAMAAMVVFAFSLGFYTNAPEKPSNYANIPVVKPDFNKLSTEELEAALKQEDVSDEMLALFSGQGEVSEAKAKQMIHPKHLETKASLAQKEDLERYILEHLDETQLIEEF
ncbi:MAG: hypothetical protein EXR21_02635 [Flavobacteriaceae bacterium]|nr:hypothetical protein [Flavobacteriaceae bacterium]